MKRILCLIIGHRPGITWVGDGVVKHYGKCQRCGKQFETFGECKSEVGV